MNDDSEDQPAWAASVYHAESLVHCSLDHAWNVMQDYEAWNPSFVGATVRRVSGEPRSEGEVVLIRKLGTEVTGEESPDFHAVTVKWVPSSRLVWYVYPVTGRSFRNFVDFGLAEVPDGVRFTINYFAQDALSGELLDQQRKGYEEFLPVLARAFKAYCESTGRNA
jgi:hypothetical protein